MQNKIIALNKEPEISINFKYLNFEIKYPLKLNNLILNSLNMEKTYNSEKDNNFWEPLGIKIPITLLPNKTVDLSKWAVVACDQFTSEPEFWHGLSAKIGNAPSTLNLVYPEVFLEENETAKQTRLKNITATMKTYLEQGILEEQPQGFIFLERTLPNGKKRQGLMLSIDLEKYNYQKGSTPLIRPTEGTVLERIPPRLRIREKALIESPHVMLLFDDPKNEIFTSLKQNLDNTDKLYDFDLMFENQHLTGHKVTNPNLLSKLKEQFSKLIEPKHFQEKYQLQQTAAPLLFAVGDGNHSIATAKAHWEKIKQTLTEAEKKNHPARFTLAEIVNLHDESLIFEPIHRVLFNVEFTDLITSAEKFFSSKQAQISIKELDKKIFKQEIENLRADKSQQIIGFVTGNQYGALIVKNSPQNLEVGTLQTFLDDYLKNHKETSIDYIHGDDALIKLSSKSHSLGLFLPAIEKQSFFKNVITAGIYPRKTFSMGDAEEKRVYLECRKIA
ncbi:MAG: DUF1015 domain-containing protein [Candidatus Margulisiibacteriota bacterium]|jgi:hypothetical protein